METEFINALKAQVNLSAASQLAHWNVDGPEFYQFHLLFERVYETVNGKIDALAEQDRGQGIEIPCKIFTDVPDVEWSTAVELAKEIYDLVVEFQSELKKLHSSADDASEYGLLNVIEDILSDCNTLTYLLGSVTKKL